jgi:aspartyl-tRNA(Asn)/glutamyl-tRNA(Gln) amidotransferase subunit C
MRPGGAKGKRSVAGAATLQRDGLQIARTGVNVRDPLRLTHPQAFPPVRPEFQEAMSLDKATVRAIAELARIEVREEELDHLAGELSNILHFVEQLSEVNTDGVAPMTSVAAITLPLRPDAVTDGGYPQAVLANAPEAEDGFFTVPKVVE